MVVSVPFNVNTDYKVETKSYTQSKGETKKNKQLEDQRHTKYTPTSVFTYILRTMYDPLFFRELEACHSDLYISRHNLKLIRRIV